MSILVQSNLFASNIVVTASIQLPSAANGIYGLRPTSDANGIISKQLIYGANPYLDTAGPMCHRVEDLALAMDVCTNLPGKYTNENVLNDDGFKVLLAMAV